MVKDLLYVRGDNMEVLFNKACPELMHLNIYLTWECNFKCVHCWVEADSSNKSIIDRDLLFLFMKQSIPLGLKSIKLTGGEPLLYQDTLKQIIIKASEYDVSVNIETNASLITPEFVDFLRENKVSLSISLNGHNSATNDSFTKCNGLFKKIVENIKLCVECGIDTEIVTCVGRYNMDYFPKTLAFLDTLNVNRIKVNPINACGRGTELFEQQLLFSDEELFYFYKDFKEIRKNTKTKVITMMPFCLEDIDYLARGDVYSCGGINLLSYLPNNQIALCGYAGIDEDIILCNYEGQAVNEIWKHNEKLLAIRENFLRLSGVCDNCIHGKDCRSLCKAMSFMRYGKWDAPYPFCQAIYDMNIFPKSRLIKKHKFHI